MLARLAARGERRPSGVPRCRRRPQPVAGAGYAEARELLAAGGVRFVPARGSRRSPTRRPPPPRSSATRWCSRRSGRCTSPTPAASCSGCATRTRSPAPWSRLRRRGSGRPPSRVERMAPLGDGVELLVGARWDPRFGPIVLVGLGGLYTEILRDVAVALAPVEAAQARAAALLAASRAAAAAAPADGRRSTPRRPRRRSRASRASRRSTRRSPRSRSTRCSCSRPARSVSTRGSSSRLARARRSSLVTERARRRRARTAAACVVTLRRERKLNALSSALEGALAPRSTTPTCAPRACVVITGGERAFSAGADVTELRDQDPASILAYYRETGDVYERVAGAPPADDQRDRRLLPRRRLRARARDRLPGRRRHRDVRAARGRDRHPAQLGRDAPAHPPARDRAGEGADRCSGTGSVRTRPSASGSSPRSRPRARRSRARWRWRSASPASRRSRSPWRSR